MAPDEPRYPARRRKAPARFSPEPVVLEDDFDSDQHDDVDLDSASDVTSIVTDGSDRSGESDDDSDLSDFIVGDDDEPAQLSSRRKGA